MQKNKLSDYMFDLCSLKSSSQFGFVIDGSGSPIGGAVTNNRDINGDGIADLLIGGNGIKISSGNTNKVFVLYGKSSLSSSINIEALNGTNGFIMNAPNAGFSIADAGDVNGDGKVDMIIGAPLANTVYVVFGNATFTQLLDLSLLNGTNGFVIRNTVSNATGYSVANAGDINGDGKDDIVIGTSGANGKMVYVLFGNSFFPASFALSSLNSQNGFSIIAASAGTDYIGYSVANAGDVNGDGKTDIIIGSPAESKAYVIFGNSSFPQSITLASLDGNIGFVMNGNGIWVGFSVTNSGDINGDNKNDIIISVTHTICEPSCLGRHVTPGKIYVVFGNSSFPQSLDLSSLNGNNGFVIRLDTSNIIEPAGHNRIVVDSYSDINGDGKNDIIIGAAHALNYSGQVYVIYGKSSFPASFLVSSLNWINGFIINGCTQG